MNKIRELTNKWEDISCSWIGKLNIVKMNILFKAISKFNTILIKRAMAFSTELEKVILKYAWK